VIPLPWERVLWHGRTRLGRSPRYVLTDFRLVETRGRGADEILLQEIGEVQHAETAFDRLAGTSTLVIHARNGRPAPLILRRVRRGAQLAALLEILARDPRPSLDARAVREALAWEPRTAPRIYRASLAGLVALLLAVFAIGVSLRGRAATITYPPDDAIYPGGEKRDRAAIVRFMETSVMPWARETLGPIKGGAGRVTCSTCHGPAAETREWRMPAVTALPKPDLALRGWETYSEGMDAQTRNAIYGYIAEADNQTKAAYMREVVMPGMARLLHRPAYDFTRPYGYNRTRLAFGCYHCHQVK
jgi:hypothetical protein